MYVERFQVEDYLEVNPNLLLYSTLTTNYVKFSHCTILLRTLKSQGYKTK